MIGSGFQQFEVIGLVFLFIVKHVEFSVGSVVFCVFIAYNNYHFFIGHGFPVSFQGKVFIHRSGVVSRRRHFVNGNLFWTGGWRLAIVIIIGGPKAYLIIAGGFIDMFRVWLGTIVAITKFPEMGVKGFGRARYLV